MHSRRSFLSAIPLAGAAWAAEKGLAFPSEVRRYADPATEFEVLRLTDPSFASHLPAYYNRAVSRHGSFMLYASARTGTVQPYRMDLKTGESVQIAAAAIVPATLSLAPDERTFFYSDGRAAFQANLGSLRVRTLYTAPADADITALVVTDDGTHAIAAEKGSAKSRLKLITLGRAPAASTIVESDQPVSDPLPRPRRAGLLYRRAEQELWIVNYDGAQNRRLRVAPGTAAQAVWAAEGPTFFYLNFPETAKALHNIREFTPDLNEDKPVSNTTQFVRFNRNADSSVFVGASGSKASSYVLLLVRSVKRELTLCEHKASDPFTVTPVFSPNSQRVFFQSDRHGKPAIYSMRVDRLVEETDE